MRIEHPILQSAIGLVGSICIRRLITSVECKGIYYDSTVDTLHPRYEGHKIYIFWHEYILGPTIIRGNCNTAVLVSHHRDGELMRLAARHLGYDSIRGSTSRGGAQALWKMLETRGKMNLALMPDGPRGPRRVLSPGVIFLASQLKMPIVAIGVGCQNAWRLNSWDRFVIPFPYSRCRALGSPAISIPPNLSRAGIEHYRQEVEAILNRLTEESEAWAVHCERRVGERPVLSSSEAFYSHFRRDEAEPPEPQLTLRRAA